MEKFAGRIIGHKKTVLFVTVGMLAVCLALMLVTKVNYNLADYLPKDAPSTKAIALYEKTFGGALPNLNVYVPDISVAQALKIKEALSELPGITGVTWLDDVADVKQPLSVYDQETVSAWYKDGAALFLATGDEDRGEEIIKSVRALCGERSLLSGELVNLATVKTSIMKEIGKIILYVVPLVLLVLLLTTSSWLEPLLFVIAIGVAIVINEGTNAFLGEISFVTRATGAVLQLAVSMDYAVFLLHRFAEYRKQGLQVTEAMRKAMAASASSIAASAMTTVFGFLALTLMRFRLGPDMGFVLAKGTLLSFMSVMFLLPVLAIYFSSLMDRTHHRSFLPSFKRFGRVAVRICAPLSVVLLLAFVPSFLAQRQNSFLFGSGGMYSETSQVYKDTEKIAQVFGESQQMALLIPAGNPGKEAELSRALASARHIASVISYETQVGAVPREILSRAQLSQFETNGYSRLILAADTAAEGEEAFQTVENVRAIAASYAGDDYYLLGQSVVNTDLKQVITGDNLPVMLAAMVSIGLILALTFRSVLIPLVLLLTIEGAIWINMAVPYYMGDTINYIGYQIVSAVQLGATVDYGILLTKRYLEHRRENSRKDSARFAVSMAAGSILTPACILVIAGSTLGFVSSNGVISQMGLIIARGTAISAGMVLLFLPAALMAVDRFISKRVIRKKEEFNV